MANKKTPKKLAENFSKCLPLLFEAEGGYSNDSHDPGGATKWGITWRDLQEWTGKAVTITDVKNITQDLAAQIYKAKYWTVVHGDDLPSGVDYCVFDYGVNSGNSRSIKTLQRVVGVKADGLVGGITLAAVNRMDPVILINKLTATRLSFLQALFNWKYFGKGWKRRVANVQKNALAWANSAKTNKPPVLVPLVDPETKPVSWWTWLFGPSTNSKSTQVNHSTNTVVIKSKNNAWSKPVGFNSYKVKVVSVGVGGSVGKKVNPAVTRKPTKAVKKKASR